MTKLTSSPNIDVLVIGGGNAGFSAATAAAESGACRVILIEKAPEEWAGGNSYFTAGAFRTVHDEKLIDMEPYTKEDFQKDMERVCLGRSDPELSKVLIEESNEAVKWLAKNGIRYQLSFNRQAYKVDGRMEERGLIADHQASARRYGVEVYYSTPAKSIVTSSTGAVTGVIVEHLGGDTLVSAKAVVLAAGGFEANPRMRSQYLGPNWDLARALEFAIRDVNARQAGNWSGCHSTCWDANAPANSGDREVSNEFTKSGYPLGLMVNTNGVRFVDEGIDMRNYTYAKFGRAIHEQPASVAYQVWDQRTIPWLRDEEYRDERVQKVWGATLEELAKNLAKDSGLNAPDQFVETVKQYNEAVYASQIENPDRKWDPAIKDGLTTQSSEKKLVLAKSNWALPLDQGPFMAVKVCCGVTFTFGGLAVNPKTTASRFKLW
ncbi:unnamed protein product [Alternaria alternata]